MGQICWNLKSALRTISLCSINAQNVVREVFLNLPGWTHPPAHYCCCYGARAGLPAGDKRLNVLRHTGNDLQSSANPTPSRSRITTMRGGTSLSGSAVWYQTNGSNRCFAPLFFLFSCLDVDIFQWETNDVSWGWAGRGGLQGAHTPSYGLVGCLGFLSIAFCIRIHQKIPAVNQPGRSNT